MKRINTILVVALLMFSMAAAVSFASAQTSGDPILHVEWQVNETSEDFEHSEQNSEWIFGPQPSVMISYADNGTNIAENLYRVEVGLDIDIEITIPKSFLGEGVGLDSVIFWGSTLEERGTFFVLQYNATADEWNKLNFHYAPGAEVPVSSDFLSLNTAQCDYDDSGDAYVITFSITFTSVIVSKVFWTGMQAIDTLGRPATPSWLASINAGTYAVPPIGLGVDVDPRIVQLPEYYYAEVTDLAGDIIHYVEPGDEFVFRIEANEPFTSVEIPFVFTFGDNVTIDYNWSMPRAPVNINTAWINFTEMPMGISFFYNGTQAVPVATYLTNITWTWSTDIFQWVVDYDILYNWSIDVSRFYVSTDVVVSNGGAMIEWTGYFTESLDLNPSPYEVGGKIEPDPYFWFVTDSTGTRINAHPNIFLHTTVSLAYMDEFIEVFLRKDGEIAHRAMQGDMLNLTMKMHAPEGLVNGTSYIEINEYNVTTDTGTQIDIAGVYVHTIRHNFTLWLETEGMESNATHQWRHKTRHFIGIDFTTDTAWSVSTVTKWVYNLDGSFAGIETEVLTDLVIIHDWSFIVGPFESTLEIGLSFSAETPSMKVSSAHIASGGVSWFQMNVSVAGENNWTLYPLIPIIGENVEVFNREVDCDVVWSPSHFILGDVDSWETQKWVLTDDGAIDLDGNVFTTDDQYFVKRTAFWHDWGNITHEQMLVGVGFDPSPGNPGDEFASGNWMGIMQLHLEFEANETFYWYHAADMSPVNQTEMSDIRSALWADMGDNVPTPEYKYVAWMSVNRTVDLTAITGLDSNSWDTTWFYWGTHQAFLVSVGEHSRLVAHFRAQYAGLLLFDDNPLGASPDAPDFYFEDGQLVTDEVTHLVLIDTVGSIEFRRPLGATNDTGSVTVPVDTEVTFGVSIYDVNVTIYPLQVEHSRGLRGPWAFRESYEGALGLNATSFDHWITHATVDEMSFDISFNVDMVSYDPNDPQKWNHAVSFKVDQVIGDFTMLDYDSSVLEGKSLAVNFFGVLGTVGRTQYSAGDHPVTDPNSDSVGAEYYQFGSADSPFANVTMGGLPYTYGGDGHSQIYISGSSTAPIGAFSAMYQSDNGATVTDWTVDASMLFMTAGYKHWGGHEIICDPVFVAYTSAFQTPSSTTTTTPYTPGEGNPMMLYAIVGGVVALVVVVCVLYRRK
ncbi:MAG: hypothetical protein ACP6KW_06135 [Candidatus Thorarchaeota archaeon]